MKGDTLERGRSALHMTSTGIELELPRKLKQLEAWYQEQGDPESAGKMQDLWKKREAGELTIAFCGHFSAGKSTLINTLCGSRVLPSGPLPTTANIASLRDGSPRTVLMPARANGSEQTGNGNQVLEPIEVPQERLDEYCRNGEEYEMVSIWGSIPLLRKGGVLLDTPGVDSGDTAHALATNSALHLADVVFYVMDYNHVQSGSNLSFARGLADWGKPLYLIINQIDKHLEEEHSFEEYQRSVEQAFKLWGISPAGIFYVSLKAAEHPLNMLTELEDTITGLLDRKERLLEFSIQCSLNHVAREFVRRSREAEETMLQELRAEAGGDGTPEETLQELAMLDRDSASDKAVAPEAAIRRDWVMKLDQLLDNTYLMTPDLRDAARRYLESREAAARSGFRLFRKKNELEHENRQEEFLTKLEEQVQAQLDWHVRDAVRKLGQAYEAWNEDWESRLDQELPRVERAWIEEQARDGAVVSGEYTLHYTAAVAAEITGRFRRAALALADGLLEVLAPRLARAQADLAARRAELARRAEAAARLQAHSAAAAGRTEQLQALLGAWTPLPPDLLPKKAGAGAGEGRGVPTPRREAARRLQPAPLRAGMAQPAPPAGRQRLLAAAKQLAAAAEALAPYPAFGSGVRELRARAAQLREGRYTIALFGAFSAGKSSFANALLGEPILPVSPHPTTAAISRILAPPSGRDHKEAAITFKSVESMQDDLAHSFDALQLGKWKPHSWRAEVARLQAMDIPASGRAHYSFLKAAATGWEEHESRLGSVLLTHLEEFAIYAAQESKACFVDSMDLYYSSPLTEQGLILVDTPGADSIHARHTGVTFEYMKQCDALLYVTYYNHAFSRVDRQFLSHLGRVKGSFALDKMFFIINAADLAASKEELEAVIGYVTNGLARAGVQEPQVYAVSSKLARQAKETADLSLLSASGLTRFEEKFFNFIGIHLSGLALESASRELELVRGGAAEWLLTLTRSREERLAKLSQLEEATKFVLSETARFAAADCSPVLRQEAEELLYHARNRIKLYAGDLFHEFFHPTLLQEEGGSWKRRFNSSFNGWLSQLSIELERELQATSLRLEKKSEVWIAEEASNWLTRMNREMADAPAFLIEGGVPWESPDTKEGMLEHTLEAAEYYGFFKNPRLFFEGGGKQELRYALERPLNTVLQKAVEEAGQKMVEYYIVEFSKRISKIAGSLEIQWNEWLSGIQAMSGELTEVRSFQEKLKMVENAAEMLRKL